jgi:hypothetical protein
MGRGGGGVVAYFEILSWYLPTYTGEGHSKPKTDKKETGLDSNRVHSKTSSTHYSDTRRYILVTIYTISISSKWF